MTRLNDFITDLELAVAACNQVPSERQLEEAMEQAAFRITRNGHTCYCFADGEILSLRDFMRYADSLVA